MLLNEDRILRAYRFWLAVTIFSFQDLVSTASYHILSISSLSNTFLAVHFLSCHFPFVIIAPTREKNTTENEFIKEKKEDTQHFYFLFIMIFTCVLFITVPSFYHRNFTTIRSWELYYYFLLMCILFSFLFCTVMDFFFQGVTESVWYLPVFSWWISLLLFQFLINGLLSLFLYVFHNLLFL